MTIPGGKHGLDCCNAEQRVKVYRTIEAFLRKQGILTVPRTSTQP